MSKKKICLFIVSFCFAIINAQDYDKFIGEWTTNKSDIILRIYFSRQIIDLISGSIKKLRL